MTTHAAPEWNDPRDVTEPVDKLRAAADQSPPEPPVAEFGPALLVVLASIAGLTLVLLAMVVTKAAEQAESVAILAMLLGTGLAIGFRKRWMR